MKICFGAQIQVTILSYKEKALVHDKGRNFDFIITKFGTHVGLTQIKFVDELCGANRSGNTFLQRKYYNPL